jgi:uncharacterized protein YbjT (DUF2867 family)
MRQSKITIIGASGKVGSQVAQALVSLGQSPTLISRSGKGLESLKTKATVLNFSLTDTKQLTEALAGSDIVLTMIASNHSAEDFLEDQRAQADSQIEAIKRAGIKKVLNLSSTGCHLIENTGVLLGLTEMEVKLNQLKEVDVLHLRPTFYMENMFYALGLIKEKGIYGLPVRADKKFPMIATKDVADKIVSLLIEKQFTGKSVLPLLGPKDYSLGETTQALGQIIGKPQMPYVQFGEEDFKQGVIFTGGTPDFAQKFLELMTATDQGLLNYHLRTPESTTKTSFETFAKTVFLPAYQSMK